MANNNENTFLSRFAVNLNERASAGKLDPVIGRDDEIRRVLQILSRRTKNNPILVGEPGVGKTAISEGIAQNIVSGHVPENLKTKKVYSLELRTDNPSIFVPQEQQFFRGQLRRPRQRTREFRTLRTRKRLFHRLYGNPQGLL